MSMEEAVQSSLLWALHPQLVRLLRGSALRALLVRPRRIGAAGRQPPPAAATTVDGPPFQAEPQDLDELVRRANGWTCGFSCREEHIFHLGVGSSMPVAVAALTLVYWPLPRRSWMVDEWQVFAQVHLPTAGMVPLLIIWRLRGMAILGSWGAREFEACKGQVEDILRKWFDAVAATPDRTDRFSMHLERLLHSRMQQYEAESTAHWRRCCRRLLCFLGGFLFPLACSYLMDCMLRMANVHVLGVNYLLTLGGPDLPAADRIMLVGCWLHSHLVATLVFQCPQPLIPIASVTLWLMVVNCWVAGERVRRKPLDVLLATLPDPWRDVAKSFACHLPRWYDCCAWLAGPMGFLVVPLLVSLNIAMLSRLQCSVGDWLLRAATWLLRSGRPEVAAAVAGSVAWAAYHMCLSDAIEFGALDTNFGLLAGGGLILGHPAILAVCSREGGDEEEAERCRDRLALLHLFCVHLCTQQAAWDAPWRLQGLLLGPVLLMMLLVLHLLRCRRLRRD